MKRLFQSIVFILFTFLGVSASSNLEFEGIAISGSPDDFANELTKKGYVFLRDRSYICYNEGQFFNSVVHLAVSEDDQLEGLSIFLPRSESWDDLLQSYELWMTYFTHLYGAPFVKDSTFTTDQQPQTPEEKLQAVKDDKCTYSAMFAQGRSNVYLTLTYSKELGFCPQVVYLNERMTDRFMSSLTEDVHMQFMGIPIDGNILDFVIELRNKGLIYDTFYKGIAVLKGSFAGYKDCTFLVYSSEINNNVTVVAVTFPVQDKWEALISNYETLRGLLIEKYGEPSECIEVFNTPIQPTTNKERWKCLISEKCDYQTYFDSYGGRISLSISCIKDGRKHKAYVSLIYIDRINLDYRNPLEDL